MCPLRLLLPRRIGAAGQHKSLDRPSECCGGQSTRTQPIGSVLIPLTEKWILKSAPRHRFRTPPDSGYNEEKGASAFSIKALDRTAAAARPRHRFQTTVDRRRIAAQRVSTRQTCALVRLISHIDRHRGGGLPPTPATPPCIRVRTRRFETVTLTFFEQCRKSERFEIRIRKPHG